MLTVIVGVLCCSLAHFLYYVFFFPSFQFKENPVYMDDIDCLNIVGCETCYHSKFVVPYMLTRNCCSGSPAEVL